MIEHQKVFLPNGEAHMVEWMTKNGELVDGKGTYQIKKLRKALSYCTDFRTAVDVGAHCGLWSMHLAKKFAHVDAFEPVAEHRDCFDMNLASANNVRMHACALGEHEGLVKMRMPEAHSSGSTMIDGDGDIPLCRMDNFHLTDVDFIKLDCEGYELFSLRGGKQTIARDLPVVCVEQKPGRAQRFGLQERGAVDWLISEFGYRMAEAVSGDFIMVPE